MDVALEAAEAVTLHGRVGHVASRVELPWRGNTNIKTSLAMALGLDDHR